MRLIDAHALWVAIRHYCKCREDALLIIGKAPTIEAVPVKYARWSEQAIRPTIRGVDEIITAFKSRGFLFREV